MMEILPKFDIYYVTGGYLGDAGILVQETVGAFPELEPGQHACLVADPENYDIDYYTALFDDIAENDNYHDYIGVPGVIASTISEVAGEGVAKRVLYLLTQRYQGLHAL